MYGISSSPLIQINLLRRNKDVFTSVTCKSFKFLSCYTINRVLSVFRPSTTKGIPVPTRKKGCAIYLTLKPFYITVRCQKNPPLRQFAGELCLRVTSRDDPASFESCLTFWEKMVGYGRVHLTGSQDIVNLCKKKKKKEGRTTCSRQLDAIISKFPPSLSPDTSAKVNNYIH